MRIDKSMVGRKVQFSELKNVEITAVGETYFLGKIDNWEGVFRLKDDWQFYEETKICAFIEEAEFDIPMGACKKCGFPLLKHERVKPEKKKVGMALAAIKQMGDWVPSGKFFASEDQAQIYFKHHPSVEKIIWPYGEVVEVEE